MCVCVCVCVCVCSEARWDNATQFVNWKKMLEMCFKESIKVLNELNWQVQLNIFLMFSIAVLSFELQPKQS